jgi:hypothetical protein
MDFIDDIDFFSAHRRRVFDALPEFPYVVDPVVGCGIDLNYIEKQAIPYIPAAAAGPAGAASFPGTVETLGQDPGYGGFPGPSGS